MIQNIALLECHTFEGVQARYGVHHLCLFFSLAMLVGGGQASGHKKVSLVLTWKKKNELAG